MATPQRYLTSHPLHTFLNWLLHQICSQQTYHSLGTEAIMAIASLLPPLAGPRHAVPQELPRVRLRGPRRRARARGRAALPPRGGAALGRCCAPHGAPGQPRGFPGGRDGPAAATSSESVTVQASEGGWPATEPISATERYQSQGQISATGQISAAEPI